MNVSKNGTKLFYKKWLPSRVFNTKIDLVVATSIRKLEDRNFSRDQLNVGSNNVTKILRIFKWHTCILFKGFDFLM